MRSRACVEVFSLSPSASMPPQICTARRKALTGTSGFFMAHHSLRGHGRRATPLPFAPTRSCESGEPQTDKRQRAGLGNTGCKNGIIREPPAENVLLLVARARTAGK